MNMRIIGILLGMTVLVLLAIYIFFHGTFDSTQSKEKIQSNDDSITITIPDAIDVVVNKNRKLPSEYRPNDLIVPNVKFAFDEIQEKSYMRKEAAIALEKLFSLAKQDGIQLHAISGFRSEQYQKSVYKRNIETQGQVQADTVSAQPGHSEHQTGLAMDVSSKSINNVLETKFSNTIEGKWLKNNAHRAGFIIRYLKEKEQITGYSYEPWHIRYVGIIAKDIYERNITLEEYLNIK
ncbi:M15 family metallopeptidase [Bacillus cereus]|uniref:M15 family metallopeptidase n=1 Tax=Bacillus cereus TaxID=1396 RepID=A0AB73UBD0_BACCE|nr:M15 family metallopeptidase [Bacillus cereus]QHV03742.1 D-alanyl-D-alanine carboxypeptidase [Bacillus cereus]QHV41698.1 M15 family metallopeptidase [Bacillus cereus]